MSRAPRVPLAVGLIAVVPAVAGVVTVLWADSVGVHNAKVEPYLYAWVSAGSLVIGTPAVLFVVGLLVTAGLVLARRMAARSALVWLASTDTTLVLVLCATHCYLLYPKGYDIWIGPSSWIGGAATAVTVGALIVTAICLGIPVTRRALDRPVAPSRRPPLRPRKAPSRRRRTRPHTVLSPRRRAQLVMVP